MNRTTEHLPLPGMRYLRMFPASAGMNRLAEGCYERQLYVPRERGDEPLGRDCGADWGHAMFPASAGMNRTLRTGIDGH